MGGVVRGNSTTQETESEQQVLDGLVPREEMLTKICLQHPSCLSWLEDVDGQTLVEHEGLRQVLWEAITAFGEEGYLNPTTLLSRIDDFSVKNWIAAAFCADSEVSA